MYYDNIEVSMITLLYSILFSVNEERISKLDEVKQPHLFTSFQLETLCNLTPSLKTKLEFIKIVGPRLVDPATSISTFMDMFRYTEEKLQVEQVLKERTFVISKAQFTDTRRSSNILSSRGGRGGAGGRGARSSLISNENSTPATPVLVSTSVSTVPTTGTTADTTATSPLHQQRKSAAMSLFQFADAANHEIEDNKTDNTTIDSTLSNALDKCEVK